MKWFRWGEIGLNVFDILAIELIWFDLIVIYLNFNSFYFKYYDYVYGFMLSIMICNQFEWRNAQEINFQFILITNCGWNQCCSWDNLLFVTLFKLKSLIKHWMQIYIHIKLIKMLLIITMFDLFWTFLINCGT